MELSQLLHLVLLILLRPSWKRVSCNLDPQLPEEALRKGMVKGYPQVEGVWKMVLRIKCVAVERTHLCQTTLDACVVFV